MSRKQARRSVAVDLPHDERRCLYCLDGADSTFKSREHVVPERLGGDIDPHILPRGVACDACNHFIGRQVEAPFTNRFDMALTRGLEGIPDRAGRLLEQIDGHAPTSRLDIQAEPGGRTVSLFAKTSVRADRGLDIEIRPLHPDPADIHARTFRALWKIALGGIYLHDGREAALSPRWDHLRRVVLGTPFRGYLLQAPFEVAVSGELAISVEPRRPESPTAVSFVMGGVALAAPLAQGAAITRAEARRHGVEVIATDAPAASRVLLRLDGERTS